jgi:hypothetical protein
MFAKKLRDPESLASYLVGKYGEVVKPFIEKISAMAQKSFTRMFKDTGTAEKNLDDLLALKESGKYGMGWYDKTAKWVKQQFGEDSDMFLRFLAVTSANGQTESGAAMALKAYSQWKGGMPFEGFRGDSMRGQLESAAKGEPLPPNTKIKNFLDALRGDPNAVVLDRWMLRALKMNDVTALKPNNYKMYESAVRQLAADNSMSPAEFQAAVWEGARVGSIQEKEAIGGRAASTKTGSARPLEDLVDRKLGGLTPEEYAHEATDHLKMMQNLYQGLAPVRKAIEKADEGHWVKTEGATADQSGHTFDPNTFEPAKHEGNVVSLISHNAKRNVLYPGRILKFKQQVQPLIDEMEKKGLKPTIGVWQLTDPKTKMPTGEFSLDLNIMVDDKDKAMEIARDNKQLAVAHLGPGGEFQGVTETGHKGKQNLPPKDYKEQPAWYKQQINRVRSFVKKAGL